MVRLVAADNRIVQCAAVRKDGWTKARRAGFFAMLSATCNVRASAAAMGMTDCGAYDVRRRDPVFAAQWREALAEGYGRLEQALMALALEGSRICRESICSRGIRGLEPACRRRTRRGYRARRDRRGRDAVSTAWAGGGGARLCRAGRAGFACRRICRRGADRVFAAGWRLGFARSGAGACGRRRGGRRAADGGGAGAGSFRDQDNRRLRACRCEPAQRGRAAGPAALARARCLADGGVTWRPWY